MYKHSPSRNKRSKGIKVKHVLQICLLVAVCFWLIYQVKHSHDKKREFNDGQNNSLATEHKDGVVKLGRKYLNPRKDEKVIKTRKQDEEEQDEETAVEEEENKHEELEEQEDNKTDEKEEDDVDDGRGGGEEIDDPAQEKSQTDNDQEVDLVDDEKEQENVDELEHEDKEAEDNNGQTENDSDSRKHYKKGGGITNTRDARDENYKADDASSAVTHDAQITTTDKQTRISGKLNQQAEKSELEHQIQSIKPDETGAGKDLSVKVEGGETANNGSYLTVRTIRQNETGITTSNGTEGSKDNKSSDNSTAVRIEPQELPLPRGNITFSEHNQDENVVEGNKNARKGSKIQITVNKLEGNSTLPSSNDLHDSTSAINIDSKDTDPSLRNSKKSDATGSSFLKNWSNVSANVSAKAEEAFEDMKDEGTDGINENLEESDSETSDELQVDPIDSSDTKNIFSNDQETLTIEASNIEEDAAAE